LIDSFRDIDIREVKPSVLAYIGDAVYEVYSRCHVSFATTVNSGKMHRLNVKYVSAPAQAKAIQELIPELTEDELYYFKRGRNSHPHSTAKNAAPGDYMNATGFEALIGYLYLTGDKERLNYVVNKTFEVLDSEE